MNSYSKTALAAAICTALSAGHAAAATFNVTNTDDSGAGSLRDALSQANGNAEADIIDLSSISGQTITLSSGVLQIQNDDITINGSGVTVDANGSSGVLNSSSTDLTINDTIITGGDAVYGGGIYHYAGNLTLSNTTVTGNNAGIGGGLAAVTDPSEVVSILDSAISGNTAAVGGGIYGFSYESILIQDSTISGNAAIAPGPGNATPTWQASDRFERSSDGLTGGGGGSWGGGYLVAASVTLERSTVTGNSAAGSGGGLYMYAADGNLIDSTISANTADLAIGGAAIVTKYAGLVRNSTVSGNSATGPAGGLFADSGAGGTMTLEFSTIVGNTSGFAGGLLVRGPNLVRGDPGSAAELNGSIVSGNVAPDDPDVALYEASDELIANFSLVGNGPSTGTFIPDATTTALLGENPILGALANNGGPTDTHLPGATSPVIDAVPPDGTVGCATTVVTDQRGLPRPVAAGCDIGSVEVAGGLPQATAVPVLDRIGLLLMAGLLGLAGLFGFRRRSGRAL